MACNCIVKDTLLVFDILNKPEDVTLTTDLRDLIPQFSADTSGIWRPVFWNEQPTDGNNKSWYRAQKPDENKCPDDIMTPDGLGISQFIKIQSPKFKNWQVLGNLQLSADLIINFEQCKNYSETILFWYRYYDMARKNDNRILPGVDLFISDGDYAVINDTPRVSPSLSGIALNIKASLDSADVPNSLRKACILASGPQIDGITEILAGTDNNLDYPRDEYGLMQPFLSGMSLKRYTDLGSNNFIVDKIDLLKKLTDKYSLQIVVPEGSEAVLRSNFISLTGPNVEIKALGDLYVSDKKQKSGYDIFFTAGNLTFSAEQSEDIFVPKTQITENDKKITVEAEPHHVNYFKINGTTVHYNLTNRVSGIFNPDISAIRLHGLGGIDFDTSSKFGSSCSENVAVVEDPETKKKQGYYTDAVTSNGPWFLQDYNDPKLAPSGIESEPTNITIGIRAHANSQFRLKDGISVNYLRSESKASCSPFITDTCNCFPLVYASPYISGQAKIENKDNILFVPNTSYYHMPSGAFYGGLDAKQVFSYGLIPPNHPAPGTLLPRTHSKFFPTDKSCSYSLDGCGDRDIDFKFPYPGEIKVTYQSTKANFQVKWGDNTKQNTGSKFTSTAGVLCLPKPSGDPDIVNVKITVPSSEPETQWGINVQVVQSPYSLDTNPQGYPVNAKKGFFHPNFGWTFDKAYYNKTSVIPAHRDPSFNDVAVESINVSFGVGNIPNNGCVAFPYGTQTVTIPYSIKLPAYITITGGVDDELLINGARVEYGTTNCIPAHGVNYSFVSNQRTFTVAAGDNFGGYAGYNLNIECRNNSQKTNYFYNAYAMYDEGYLPGYNFIYSVSGLTDGEKSRLNSSTYVGLPTNGQSYYIANKWTKHHYIPSESLILEQMPFEFINLNHKYGYAYNDFVYEEQSNGNIIINSSNGSDRSAAFLDMPYFKNDKFVLYAYDDVEKTKNVTVNFASGNTIRINESPLPAALKKGFLQRTTDNQSVLIYQPYTTIDKNINVGKWGNMSYGDAVKEAAKFLNIDEEYDLRRYNNSALRTGTSRNTSWSWGIPVAISNNYSADNQTYYFPTTRLFPHFIDGQRVIHTLGYNNDYTVDGVEVAQPQGDRIVASGSIGETAGYIYLGSYIGNYTIGVVLNDPSAVDGTVKLYHMDQQVASTSVSNTVNGTIYLDYNKQDYLPVYAKLSLESAGSSCLGSVSSSALLIKTYSVKISDSLSNLKTKSRLSYYGHSSNSTGVYINKSYADGYDNTILKINKEQVSPLRSKISYLRSSSLDYSPYMDMHIFARDSQNMPFVSQSGYIYFEDFLKPKSFSYIANEMEVPYNEDLYWLNFPKDQSWSILTSRGLLLESNKTYKILKSLFYDCQGKAQDCSTKYRKDLCEDAYELSEGEALELLGLSSEDRQFIDIITKSFPKDCATIDKCCDQKSKISPFQACLNKGGYFWSCYGLSSTSAYESCLEQQKNERESCAKMWKDKSTNTSCLDVCPTGNITGIIVPSAEYYVLSVKNNLRPDLDTIKTAEIKFFNASQSKNLPCTTVQLPTIGTSFFRNITCTNTNNKCDYITPIEYNMGSQYVPGDMLDLSPLVLGATWNEYPVPSSVIMNNELRYRSLIPHPNQIALPLEEYDRIADSKYVITHNFNIKSKQCIPAGQLFDIAVDNIVCNFQVLVNASGSIIRSSCFQDIVVKSNPAKITVGRAICEGSFTCKSDGTPCEDADTDPACNPLAYYGQGSYGTYGYCVEEASCDQAQEYLDSVFGKNSSYVADICTDVSLDEDHFLDCRYCGPQSCSASISYYEPMEQECHCPDWAELVDAPDNIGFGGNKACVHSQDITYLVGSCGDTKTVKGCDYWDYGYYGTVDGKCYFPASCFAAIAGPTEEELTAYEEACPEGIEQSLKRTEQEVISIAQEPNPEQRRALQTKQVESQSEYLKKACEISTTWVECATKCSKDLDACNAQIPPGEPRDGCYSTYYSCYCDCQKEQNSANNKNLKNRTSYYNCYNYCNISDSIWDYYYGYGYWWYGWGDNCKGNPCWNGFYWWYGGSSWTNPKDDACAPGGCGYSACENLEKRMAMSQTIQDCECKAFNGGPNNGLTGRIMLDCTPECVELKVEKSEQISSSYTILTREKTYISKSKTNYVSMKEKTNTTQTRKVINKKFEITYKNKEACKNCTKDQICCDNQCIDKDTECCENKVDINLNLKFEIYDNMIVVFLNNNTADRLCVNRGNYGLFKCPKITFNSKNSLLYMCDSVTSECTDCYSGEFI